MQKVVWLCVASILLLFGSATAAKASNILLNPSFETPVQGNNGNHIGAVPDNWAADAGNGAFNLVRDTGVTTPAQDGNQYVDLTNGGTFITQSFTLSGTSSLDFGAWFSPRDGSTGSGGVTAIYDSTNTTLLASSPRVQNPDSNFVWLESENIVVLPAGTYTFRATLDDAANVDSAFVIPTAVPEPSSLALLGLGALGLVALARRR